MNELEMCKAMSELEGFQCVEWKGLVLVSKGFSCDKPYNPITDLALNCALRDKYEVEIEYWLYCVSIDKDNGVNAQVFFGDGVSICYAVVECILRVNGLYRE